MGAHFGIPSAWMCRRCNEIRELSPHSSQVRYIYLHTNTAEKGMNPPFLPPSYGLISIIFISKSLLSPKYFLQPKNNF